MPDNSPIHILSPVNRANTICGAAPNRSEHYDGLDAAYRAMAYGTAPGITCPDCIAVSVVALRCQCR